MAFTEHIWFVGTRSKLSPTATTPPSILPATVTPVAKSLNTSEILRRNDLDRSLLGTLKLSIAESKVGPVYHAAHRERQR